ncbi:MAG TPA: hypothetical protein VMM92_11800 [Thermoanaerobaculia bacterium]|nr:hypothetical protein [Thermoanaerobaculia bacterium]
MKLLKLERRSDPLLPLGAFLGRMLRTLGFVLVLLALGLGIGICGYHWFQRLGWLDSLLNASMILTGMGPVDPPKTAAGKWFGSFYALFSGIAFLTCVGIGITPIAHRILHWFHQETGAGEEEEEKGDEGGEEKKRPRVKTRPQRGNSGGKGNR